jgi:Bacterial regulatory proteins, luxR family.
MAKTHIFPIGIKILGLLFLFCCVFSCNPSHNPDKKLTSKAMSLLFIKPDSTLLILDSLKMVDGLITESKYYILLSTAANIEAGKSAFKDTTIFDITPLFSRKNESEELALAYYYSGNILYKSGDYAKAMENLLNAQQLTEKTTNYALKGRIRFLMGFSLFNQLSHEESIPHLKEAIRYYNLAGDDRNNAMSLLILGGAYKAINIDSALVYFDKALAVAQEKKLSGWLKQGALASMGVIYQERGDWVQAKNCFKESLAYPTDMTETSRTYANLAQVFVNENKIDSAYFYATKAYKIQEKDQNEIVITQIYQLLSQIEQKTGNYVKSVKYLNLFIDNNSKIQEENHSKSVRDIQTKYYIETEKNQNAMIQLRQLRIIIIMLIGLICISLITLLLYRKSSILKKNALEAQNGILSLQKMAQTFDEKEQSFRNILLHQFDILKKATLLNVYIFESEKKKSSALLNRFNEIVYGQGNLNWELLYEVMNRLYGGLFDRLKAACPDINETEFKICCLTYAEFSSIEIAIILNLSVNTVQMKRSSVRKKLNIEPMGNIAAFLNLHFGLKSEPE